MFGENPAIEIRKTAVVLLDRADPTCRAVVTTCYVPRARNSLCRHNTHTQDTSWLDVTLRLLITSR